MYICIHLCIYYVGIYMYREMCVYIYITSPVVFICRRTRDAP